MTPTEKAAALWGASEERKRVVAHLRQLADKWLEDRDGYRASFRMPLRAACAGILEVVAESIEKGEHAQ